MRAVTKRLSHDFGHWRSGFIGANFILDWLSLHDEPILNLDKLTYAGNLDNLRGLEGDSRYIFAHGDIADSQWWVVCSHCTGRARSSILRRSRMSTVRSTRPRISFRPT